MKRCPRCDRPLEDVPPGATMRMSDGRQVVFGGTRPGSKCSGCEKSPAYCDCPVQSVTLDDRSFVDDESALDFEEGSELDAIEGEPQ